MGSTPEKKYTNFKNKTVVFSILYTQENLKTNSMEYSFAFPEKILRLIKNEKLFMIYTLLHTALSILIHEGSLVSHALAIFYQHNKNTLSMTAMRFCPIMNFLELEPIISESSLGRCLMKRRRELTKLFYKSFS